MKQQALAIDHAPRLLIANSKAGSSTRKSIARLRSCLSEHVTVSTHFTETPDDLRALLQRFPDRQVIVAGGDGSVHAVVNALWHIDKARLRDTPISIVPVGTGNDLAGALGITDDTPDSCASIVLSGTPRRLDAVRSSRGGVFVNAAHFGIGAEAARRGEALKSVLGNLAYRVGGLRAAVANPSWEVEVDLDGAAVHVGKAAFVGVALSPRVGGGIDVASDADPSDGKLDLVVIKRSGRLADSVRLAKRAREGELDQDELVTHHRGSRVGLRSDPGPLDVDGELEPDVEAVDFELVPGAWLVRVPATPNRSPLG